MKQTKRLLFLLIPFVFVPLPAKSVEINVNSTADVVADDGNCTLREAIISANDDSPSGSAGGECPAGNGNDRILLPKGIYSLSIAGTHEDDSATGDLDVLESLEIRGSGDASETVIDANSIDRVFYLSAATVKMTDLTIEGGQTPGVFGDGAGIFVDTALTLNNVVLRDNHASGWGGAMFVNYGTVNMQNARITENVAFSGGGVFSAYPHAGLVSITSSQIDNNVAEGDGGGLVLEGGCSILDTSIVLNTAQADGGGLLIKGSVGSDPCRLERTLVAGNVADDYGGGIYYPYGGLSIHNSTVSSNSSGTSADEIFIPQAGGELVLRNVTLYDETPSTGGVLATHGDLVTSSNTIFFGTCSGESLSSLGGNIESPGNTCGLAHAADKSGVSASTLNLEPLDDNGGATLSHYPRPPSAAVEGGHSTVCEEQDQRGINRPQDADKNGSAICDVGAIEAVPCTMSESLTLEYKTEYSAIRYEACSEILVGPSYLIGTGADVTLRAGGTVILRDGFSVESGAKFRIEIDPLAGRNP